MSEPTDRERLEAIAMTIKGLSLEVAGLRNHTASSADFLLSAIRELMQSVQSLLDKRK